MPINHSAINDEVAAVAPKILQIIASRGAIAAGDAFERKLYVARRQMEKAAALPAINADVAGFIAPRYLPEHWFIKACFYLLSLAIFIRPFQPAFSFRFGFGASAFFH